MFKSEQPESPFPNDKYIKWIRYKLQFSHLFHHFVDYNRSVIDVHVQLQDKFNGKRWLVIWNDGDDHFCRGSGFLCGHNQ